MLPIKSPTLQAFVWHANGRRLRGKRLPLSRDGVQYFLAIKPKVIIVEFVLYICISFNI
jgi:hypothetical protein